MAPGNAQKTPSQRNRRAALGGEFEFSRLAVGSPERLTQLTNGVPGTWTSSGRSALTLVLRHLRQQGVSHVHAPAYLCESVLTSLRQSGLRYSFYPVDENLVAHPEPPPGAAILLLHYFGWTNPALPGLRRARGLFHLIEDSSHLLPHGIQGEPETGQFVVASARKFGPMPMGGWCNVRVTVDPPSPEVEALAWRSVAARLVRGAYLMDSAAPIDPSLEALYLDAFAAVDSHLDSHPAETGVPQIVLDLIAGVDWVETAAIRRANWQQLDRLLDGQVVRVTPDLLDSTVPLGYVIRLEERDRVRAQLAAERIFCPIHWPLPAEINRDDFPQAAALERSCLTLPIDQRYGADDMERLAAAVKAQL